MATNNVTFLNSRPPHGMVTVHSLSVLWVLACQCIYYVCVHLYTVYYLNLCKTQKRDASYAVLGSMEPQFGQVLTLPVPPCSALCSMCPMASKAFRLSPISAPSRVGYTELKLAKEPHPTPDSKRQEPVVNVENSDANNRSAKHPIPLACCQEALLFEPWDLLL